jgi:hypothetical protein
MDDWTPIPADCTYKKNEVYVQYPGFIVRADPIEWSKERAMWMIAQHSVVSFGPQLSMASSLTSEVSAASIELCMDIAYLQLMAGVHNTSIRDNGPISTKEDFNLALILYHMNTRSPSSSSSSSSSFFSSNSSS